MNGSTENTAYNLELMGEIINFTGGVDDNATALALKTGLDALNVNTDASITMGYIGAPSGDYTIRLNDDNGGTVDATFTIDEEADQSVNAQAIVDSVNGLTGTQYAASRTNDGSAVTITSNVTDFSVAATGANSANVPLNSLGATSGEGDHLVAYAAGFGLTISKNSNTVTVSLNDEFEYHVTQADTKTLLGYTSNQSTTVTAVVAVRATQAFALDQFSTTTESYSLKIDGNDVAFAHEAETAGTAALTMKVGSQQGTNYSIAMSAKGVNKTIEFKAETPTRPPPRT